MNLLLIALLGILAVGCSTGLQEKAFKNEHGVYVVSQSFVNDRLTASQPHTSATLACWKRHTSEEMAELRKDGADHSWYHTCQPIEQYKEGMYTVTADQPLATVYQGPISAAVLGGSIGAGLALSGDTVNQSGGNASANATAKAGRGHHRR